MGRCRRLRLQSWDGGARRCWQHRWGCYSIRSPRSLWQPRWPSRFVLQVGLAVVARFAGVGGAVLARGTCDALVRRASFPVGSDWDWVALIGVILGAVLLLWPHRRE